MNNKILVLPDIHGRRFWKKPCENIEDYDKVIFLGDYLDPYDFEGITVIDAIKNFKEIIEFKKNNVDKVILLLGNHDMPYFSSDYYFFSHYHCRHSEKHHKTIATLFEQNRDFFKIAHVENVALLRIIIHEGRNRQIRRMCEQVGLKVVGLKTLYVVRKKALIKYVIK